MLNHSQAADLLASAAWIKLANNTWLQPSTRSADDFGIKFYDTEIVTIHKDGTYSAYMGTQDTTMTRKRIRDYSPIHIGVREGKTAIWHEDTGYRPFVEGLRVNRTGLPIDYQARLHLRKAAEALIEARQKWYGTEPGSRRQFDHDEMERREREYIRAAMPELILTLL